jgi:hypothetical protein
MRFWFDTEFIEDGRTIDLISIGIVSEDNRSYYAEIVDCDLSRASEWVRNNVLPRLGLTASPPVTRKVAAANILRFVGHDKPEFWAYFADYDWVALCQLYGTMMDLPKGWPMYCRDVKQLCDSIGNPSLPIQDGPEHHALADALWTKRAWDFLMVRSRAA